MIVALPLGAPSRHMGYWMDVRRVGRETVEVQSHATSPPDFDRVYTDNFSHVARWMRAFGAPATDVDDLTQEVFLVVRRKLATFDGRNLRAWLYRITQRTVSDFRRRSWFKRFYSRTDGNPDIIASRDQGPHDALERRDAAAILERALARMSRIRRTTFVLFEIEGYTAPEIAELEGVPVNTVHTRLHHARRDFLAFLSKETGMPLGRVP